MTATDSVSDPSVVAPPRARRNREELEALAATFVNSRLQKKVRLAEAAPLRPRVPRVALVAGAALLGAGLVAAALWPEPQTAGPARDAATRVQEAQLWTQRLEAERERRRKELQSGRDYLEKIASVDSALLADMTSRAQALSARTAAPAASAPTGEPTPRREPVPAVAAPVLEPAAAREAGREPAEAPASGAPAAPVRQAVEVAAAAVPKCNIHVSELSGSGTLTYADVARMKGARTGADGHVFTPPVPANGRTVVFEVMPSGCVRIARAR